jgi:hypothetical protein
LSLCRYEIVLLKLANELSVARDAGSNYFCVIKLIQKLAQMKWNDISGNLSEGRNELE